MKSVLVLGSGGREHAIVHAISKSRLLDKLYCAPGNPGTAEYAENIPLNIRDFNAIADVVKEKSIDIVVVGPEEPLVNGLRDFLISIDPNLIFVGPGREGARLEGSKEFAKRFMTKYDIPTASYRSFDRESFREAVEFLKSLNPPYVLKADGLAAGKGVVIPENFDDAVLSLKEMFDGKFGEAGSRVVIEEFLNGIELSVFIYTNGTDYVLLPSAKDYKRIGEGDKGLNTGGMGAVSPVPFADKPFMERVEEQIIRPTLRGLKEEGIDYTGFIFFGLMNCCGSPFVIEYNVRLGDPETEVILPLIESDLLEVILNPKELLISDRCALTVVAVSGGYPGEYEKGYPIIIDSDMEPDSIIYQSGTSMKDGAIVTWGGRVLAVTALANKLEEAVERAYSCLERIKFKNIYYRGDLGDDLKRYL